MSPVLSSLKGRERCGVVLSDGPFGEMPLSRERGSGLSGGGTCGSGGESGESGAEKPSDGAGSEDFEIKAGLASWVPDDLSRTGAVDVSTSAEVVTVDRIPLMSASGARFGVARPCCLLLSAG